MAFTLPPLPYPSDALEVAIDKMTMEIHHDRHHKGYVDNLNKALESAPQLQAKSVEEILRGIQQVPEGIRQAVINNGGGHANHSLFWIIMGPNAGGDPTGPLADDIKATFGDFTSFKDKLKAAAASRFGSGWGWLVLGDGRLQVISTANQDNPLMQGLTPIMGIDVWEHAYYLRYQNKRADYLDAWWKVANWPQISANYTKAKAGR